MKEIVKHQQQNEVMEVDVKTLTSFLDAQGLTSNLNQKEKTMFLEICTAYKLNPFKREIYASKYGDNFSIVVGYEVYLKRAERTGKLSGWSVTTTGSVDKKDLTAILTIHRKDFDHPFIHEVLYSEYAQYTKTGQLNKFWREKPVTMIKKVAIGQGFRLCFPDELGGMPYTEDEVPSVMDTSYEDVSDSPKKITANGNGNSNGTKSNYSAPAPKPAPEAPKEAPAYKTAAPSNGASEITPELKQEFLDTLNHEAFSEEQQSKAKEWILKATKIQVLGQIGKMKNQIADYVKAQTMQEQKPAAESPKAEAKPATGTIPQKLINTIEKLMVNASSEHKAKYAKVELETLSEEDGKAILNDLLG